MSQHMHEELEMGQHLDQTLRTAITGVAQLVERLARSSAERDQVAAQVLRDRLLQARLEQRSQPADHSATRDQVDQADQVDRPDRHSADEAQQNEFSADSAAHGYFSAAHGETDAERTTEAWAAAMRDVATDPSDIGAAAAADELHRHAQRAHGLDLAAAVTDAINDGLANTADRTSEARAARRAAHEEALIQLPAFRENPDRGVSPTKAATPQERVHRQQTWEMARREWESERHDLTSAATRTAAWQAMPMEAKTELYWRAYDSEAARTVPAGSHAPGSAGPNAAAPAVGASTERGLAPSKAPTAEEREHRERAWQMARESFDQTLPEGTTAREATRRWEAQDWPDKAVRYWTAYDDPASRPASSPALSTPDSTSAGQDVSRARIVELNEQAADYFAAQAGPGSKGRMYLEERLGREVLENGPWRTGYAPAGWTNLTDHLRAQGATTEEVVAAGLGRVSSRGNVIDAFRDRATVAVRDQDGATVGFVGRDLSGAPNAPKYLNTADTAAYQKGGHLLGLYEAPAGARLVRVEGPIDAMAITAAGDGRYAGVSALGTALTGSQADQLAERAGGRLWEALDSDRAGSIATERDFWLLRERDVDSRVLPTGQDPAQLWHDEPGQLRTILDVADAAPTAGLVVIDNAVSDLRDGLVAGDADAYEDLAATQDKVAAGLSDQDRSQLSAYANDVVAQLRDNADTARAESGYLESAGEDAGAAATVVTGESARDALQESAEASRQGSDRLNSRSADLDAAGNAAAASIYDRGATVTVSGVGDPEAVTARRASAPGFAQPTRDMLSDAQKRSGAPARPAAGSPGSLGRVRTQRR